MSTTRLIANRFLFAVPVLLVLLASTLAPAVAAQTDAPASGVTYHHMNWGSSPEARYLQMFRARHAEVPADRDVAVVLYDRDGVTVAAATASINGGNEDHAVPVDVFEGGAFVRTDQVDLQGKKVDQSTELLKAWTDINGVTEKITRGESENQPAISGFPGMRDFTFNFRTHDVAPDRLKEDKDKVLRHWREDRGSAIGTLVSSLFTAPVSSAVAAVPMRGVLVDRLDGHAPSPDAGGTDLGTAELRHLADPGPDQGLRYSVRGLSTARDMDHETGRANLQQASDAFFVSLALTPDKLWVNLNPAEPDRIIDPALAATDAGRVLLRADLELKKSVGRLIHPDTELGARFWGSLSYGPDRQVCLSFRQWIVPGPAEVRTGEDSLTILEAPLQVRLESDYRKDHAQDKAQCASAGQDVLDRNERVYRDMILPAVQKAVDTAPEYADLRRVHLSRVAAAWYRDLSSRRITTYGSHVDSRDTTSWPAREPWSPRKIFDDYVASHTKGEFTASKDETKGDHIITHTHVYGGVDLSHVPFTEVDDAQLQSRWPNQVTAAADSAQRLAPESSTRVWLGVHGTPQPPEVLAAVADQPGLGKWAWAGIALAGLVGLFVLWAVMSAVVAAVLKRPERFWVWVDRAEARDGATVDAFAGADQVRVEVPPGSNDRDPVTGPDGRVFGVRIRRVPMAAKGLIGLVAVVGAVVWFVVWPDPSRPPGLVTPVTGQAPVPVQVALPSTPPYRVTSVTRPPRTPGLCFGGKIPELGVAVPGSVLPEVDCGSPDAHYRTESTYPGTTDLSLCTDLAKTRYAYAETRIRGSLVTRTVYCLVGLGPYAR